MSNHPTDCGCNVPDHTTDTCDGCSQRRPGYTHYHYCTPVLHLCHECGRTEPPAPAPEPEPEPESDPEPDFDDPMDGDHETALASCGWGTDEDYGYYGGGEDWF